MFGHIGHFAPFSVLNQGASPAFAKLASQYSPPPDQWPDCFSARYYVYRVIQSLCNLRFNNKKENMQYLGSVYYPIFWNIFLLHRRGRTGLWPLQIFRKPFGLQQKPGNVGVDGGSLWGGWHRSWNFLWFRRLNRMWIKHVRFPVKSLHIEASKTQAPWGSMKGLLHNLFQIFRAPQRVKYRPKLFHLSSCSVTLSQQLGVH